MRSVTEYMSKALELDGLAAATTEAALKKRYGRRNPIAHRLTRGRVRNGAAHPGV